MAGMSLSCAELKGQDGQFGTGRLDLLQVAVAVEDHAVCKGRAAARQQTPDQGVGQVEAIAVFRGYAEAELLPLPGVGVERRSIGGDALAAAAAAAAIAAGVSMLLVPMPSRVTWRNSSATRRPSGVFNWMRLGSVNTGAPCASM